MEEEEERKEKEGERRGAMEQKESPVWALPRVVMELGCQGSVCCLV